MFLEKILFLLQEHYTKKVDQYTIIDLEVKGNLYCGYLKKLRSYLW